MYANRIWCTLEENASHSQNLHDFRSVRHYCVPNTIIIIDSNVDLHVDDEKIIQLSRTCVCVLCMKSTSTCDANVYLFALRKLISWKWAIETHTFIHTKRAKVKTRALHNSPKSHERTNRTTQPTLSKHHYNFTCKWNCNVYTFRKMSYTMLIVDVPFDGVLINCMFFGVLTTWISCIYIMCAYFKANERHTETEKKKLMRNIFLPYSILFSLFLEVFLFFLSLSLFNNCNLCEPCEAHRCKKWNYYSFCWFKRNQSNVYMNKTNKNGERERENSAVYLWP